MLGVLHQAAGDDVVEVVVGLETTHSDLQEKQPVPALLLGVI